MDITIIIRRDAATNVILMYARVFEAVAGAWPLWKECRSQASLELWS
jgi:hypothetical protein